ncbi:MAG: biotin--[acetyl-CoA-carboxylase] ligase [Candidatus Heteroscillospira sp.]|jgi:BirA family biotin operon repressor/biotin-[acetyl-CoA-carboxylase] ligase
MSLKSDILSELEKNRGAALSGQELSEKYGVSRSAVWKAVNTLKNEGHHISSAPKLGYSLMQESDVLSPEGIRAALPEKLRDMDIRVLEETGSTNNECKRLISGGISGYTLVAAERQTAGKGRLGRSFFSPEGSVYMSLAFRVDAEIADAVKLTTAASVAVARAVESLTDYRPAIKWVNDVYLDGKKICGILTEGVTDMESGRVRHMVIGIGLNCGSEPFPPELRDVAASIDRGNVSRSRFIAAITTELVNCIEGAPFMDDYRARSCVLGKRIKCIRNGAVTPAEAIAIDDDGALIVRLEDGREERLNTGEISVRTVD